MCPGLWELASDNELGEVCVGSLEEQKKGFRKDFFQDVVPIEYGL